MLIVSFPPWWFPSSAFVDLTEVKGLFWSSNFCSGIGCKHHVNTRLPTYSPFIYGLLTLAKLPLKALGGGPSIPILVLFNENGIKKQRGEAEYNEERHIALFSLLPPATGLHPDPQRPVGF